MWSGEWQHVGCFAAALGQVDEYEGDQSLVGGIGFLVKSLGEPAESGIDIDAGNCPEELFAGGVIVIEGNISGIAEVFAELLPVEAHVDGQQQFGIFAVQVSSEADDGVQV